MGKIKDLSGNKFSRLTAIEFKKVKNHRAQWLCKCDCGNYCVANADALQSGKKKSCGCLQIETYKRAKTSTHKLTNTRLYRIWAHIKSRCYSESNERYSDYGGRGIIMDENWKNDFMSFYNWAINNGYSDKLTIDRIDNNKGYSPDNCKWSTCREQCNNRRSNRLVTYNNKTQCLMEWSKELDIPYYTLQNRLDAGWQIDKAFTEKTKVSLYTYNGKSQRLNEWAKELGIDRRVLSNRINKLNWEIGRAFTQPIIKKEKDDKLYTFNGKSQTLKEWAKEYDIKYQTLVGRVYKHNWSIEKALTKQVRKWTTKK